MARTGGRRIVWAWTIGVLSLAVVIALAVLARPLFAPSADWVVKTLGGQASSAPDPIQTPSPSLPAADSPCAVFFSPDMWARLVSHAGAEPVVSKDAPQSAVNALHKIVAAEPFLSCTFARPGSSERIVTTLSRVIFGTPLIAQKQLAGSGLLCRDQGSLLRCDQSTGGVSEEDVFGGELWVTTSFVGWQPAGYTDDVTAHVWPQP